MYFLHATLMFGYHNLSVDTPGCTSYGYDWPLVPFGPPSLWVRYALIGGTDPSWYQDKPSSCPFHGKIYRPYWLLPFFWAAVPLGRCAFGPLSLWAAEP